MQERLSLNVALTLHSATSISIGETKPLWHDISALQPNPHGEEDVIVVTPVTLNSQPENRLTLELDAWCWVATWRLIQSSLLPSLTRANEKNSKKQTNSSAFLDCVSLKAKFTFLPSLDVLKTWTRLWSSAAACYNVQYYENYWLFIQKMLRPSSGNRARKFCGCI